MPRVPPAEAVVQERRHGLPFIPAALDDLGLDVYAFRVFCRIVRRAGDAGTCFESVPKMATALGLWRPTVTRAVRALADLGLVAVEARTGRTGIITVRAPAGWLNTDQGGNPPRYGNRPGVGLETALVPGLKTAHKGTPLKVLPEGTPILSSPAARSSSPSRSKPTTVTTTARTDAGEVVRAEVLSKEGAWSREACDDWIARFEGTAPGDLIRKALKPLVAKHGWVEVRPAWRSYLQQAEADYNPTAAKFANTYGRWSGTAAPAHKPTREEQNRDVLSRFVGGERR